MGDLNENAECKGKIYRASRNEYVNDKGHYVYTERMVPLKRENCPGCHKCGYLDDDLQEFAAWGEGAVGMDDFEHGAKYELKVTNTYRDWETGIVDEWDLGFVKIKDKD